jgi:hypothetical protein
MDWAIKKIIDIWGKYLFLTPEGCDSFNTNSELISQTVVLLALNGRMDNTSKVNVLLI